MRVQFGRPIGQFQAVKHALADMLVAVEQCAAVAWDAAAAWSEDGNDDSGGNGIGHDRDLSARIAGAVALGAAAHCAKQSSRFSAASASRGSTTRTSTSSGPWPICNWLPGVTSARSSTRSRRWPCGPPAATSRPISATGQIFSAIAERANTTVAELSKGLEGTTVRARPGFCG